MTKEIIINQTTENTAGTAFNSLQAFVSSQHTPDHNNDTVISLIDYNVKKNEYNKPVNLCINLKPITNMACFREVVACNYYSQLLNKTTAHLTTLTDKSSERQLTAEEKAEKSILEEYKKELEESLTYFETPVQEYDDLSIKVLSETDLVAQALAGSLTGELPFIAEMNPAIQKAQIYYNVTRDIKEKGDKTTEKTAYAECRSELEKVCNALSMEETCYSKAWNNHANAVLTKDVTMDILSRYYKGRKVDKKTGKVAKGFDKKGATMKKELVLACIEKLYK